MNFDDPNIIQKLDTQHMLGEIDRLPDQLASAWKSGLQLPLPVRENITRVVIAGMGGSAIGADLLAAYAAPLCKVPVFIHRDYCLPAWASGPETLVIASSHSGNTEETISAFEQAGENGCSRMVVTTGGRLAQMAAESSLPVWRFVHSGQPRAAVGFSFGLLLAAFTQLGLLNDPVAEVEEAVEAMRRQKGNLALEVPASQNPAKRQAGQLIGRLVNVLGAGILAPVARRWKGQVNELGKAWGQFDALPEADHNTLAGLLNPEDVLSRTISLFLVAPSYHPRNRIRADLTRRAFMLEGLNTDVYLAKGESRLAHQWTALHFGDYLAFYLAIAYGVDPTPVDVLENFKRELRNTR